MRMDAKIVSNYHMCLLNMKKNEMDNFNNIKYLKIKLIWKKI